MSYLWINFEDITVKTDLVKTFFIIICTYYTFLKIINSSRKFNIKLIIIYVGLFFIDLISILIKNNLNFFMHIVCIVFLLSSLCSVYTKNKFGYTMLIILISLSINYILLTSAIFITFLLNSILIIKYDLINLILMITIHISLLCLIFRIKKFKYGIAFLQKNSKNEYMDMLILNICISILFLTIILSNYNVAGSRSFFIAFIIFSIVMFVTIQKSLQLYYKQKLLIQELNETKEELENKKKEVEELEKENLNFSKTSHTLAHKQRALEYKINQLILKNEIAEEIEIKDSLENISKEMYKTTATIELDKTGIPQIDNMLEYMQSECIKNEIEFELQIIGNIHSMTNNLISKEDLETLIADHIKNAIIAINHTDNLNKSILVKLGKIDGIYSLYIYDSGIEFQKETLENLGKKPSTTHSEEGGTGMGFMNTFDTLKKYKASLTINELNPPNRENYTKVLIIKFDKKEEFKIISYREEKELSYPQKMS